MIRRDLLFIGILILLGMTVMFRSALAQDGDEETAIVEERMEDYTVRPIEVLLDEPLVVTNFATDGSATVPISTSLPVACTLVYGTSEDFGMLTLDQDMAGGTHADHSPLLTGLKSETTYYYRVHGFDDEGILYISEVMTFTTPDFEALAATDNLASPENGAIITGFSSAFGDAALDERWGAGSAFDDNANTQWSSAGDGDAAWIEVELKQKAHIDSVEFWSRSMSDGSSITLAFTITTEDGTTYGPFELESADDSYQFDVEIEAQRLRFDLIDTTGGNTGVVNIAVYGAFIKE